MKILLLFQRGMVPYHDHEPPVRKPSDATIGRVYRNVGEAVWLNRCLRNTAIDGRTVWRPSLQIRWLRNMSVLGFHRKSPTTLQIALLLITCSLSRYV